jgi:MarR family 2-MHQ and catechol resistance regulon transcriptional repressor
VSDAHSRKPPERPPRTEGEERALKLWIVLARATGAIAARLQVELAAHGLTPTEFGILEVLYHKGPLLLGEVQRRILISSGGVTYLVDRLEQKGYVERKSCSEDRRARYAALTGSGEKLIDEIFPEHAASMESLMSELSVEEQEIAYRLIRRLGLAAAGTAGGAIIDHDVQPTDDHPS